MRARRGGGRSAPPVCVEPPRPGAVRPRRPGLAGCALGRRAALVGGRAAVVGGPLSAHWRDIAEKQKTGRPSASSVYPTSAAEG